ncbi:S8 family serine peptidase [Aquibacillus sediminis]|uniref:S8 family serine peptidase n=1 Tax=Aquibacillus sediminis TaxID=2574734 RepID=UPI001108E30F|nr:S8 family serine peptidase [Aquibacillus sediminis]
MKLQHILITALLIYINIPWATAAQAASTPHSHTQDKQSIIIEVEGDPEHHKTYIENYHPFVEVVHVYDTIFNGLALQAKPSQLADLEKSDFVKQTYPVRVYETTATTQEPPINQSVPFLKNNQNGIEESPYTGEGVKVGVIDTGVDYSHPDLKLNYQGGYDLVDLDDDPMETKPEQGMPTIHGTHVSGIIAGNGRMAGVAPEAELYGYRALGPGGRGTSVQVIAAIEKAVKDGMDIINMSLGNTVNGPDWPTSIAVNKATELGVAVVIANGNAGPDRWTVGSPATSTDAISVGASTPPLKMPYLYESFQDKKIVLAPLMGSTDWDLEKDYAIVDGGLGEEKPTNATDKIVLFQRGEIPFAEKARLAEQAGARAVLIYNNEEGDFPGSVTDGGEPIEIPVASISKKDGEWLKEHVIERQSWVDTKYERTQDDIASFSSRGPVTANWHIKPEIVAPGAAINSTVPDDGYEELQGTSMAAPHVAGGLALVKQAHPDWSPAQLKGVLLTTAHPLSNGETFYDPIEQGMGRMQPDQAIQTSTIIHNPMLAFGKIDTMKENREVTLEIENVSEEAQTYSFNVPKQQRGMRWHLPTSFTVEAGQAKTVTIQLDVTSSLLEEGLHQGWLQLKQADQTFHLPYLFLNKDGDYPKAMGMEFTLQTFSSDEYQYRVYLPEGAKKIEVDLYDPITFKFDRTLLELHEQPQGMIEGTMLEREIGDSGYYLANITIETYEGETHSYPTELEIE